jgi:magnesium chelatase family protein
LRDRFDLALELPAVTWAELRQTPPGEPSATVRVRTAAARERQLARQGSPNGRLTGRALRQHCGLAGPESESLLAAGVTTLQLSARAVTRVLRVARTIADLAGTSRLESHHVAEALQFRSPHVPR